MKTKVFVFRENRFGNRNVIRHLKALSKRATLLIPVGVREHIKRNIPHRRPKRVSWNVDDSLKIFSVLVCGVPTPVLVLSLREGGSYPMDSVLSGKSFIYLSFHVVVARRYWSKYLDGRTLFWVKEGASDLNRFLSKVKGLGVFPSADSVAMMTGIFMSTALGGVIESDNSEIFVYFSNYPPVSVCFLSSRIRGA